MSAQEPTSTQEVPEYSFDSAGFAVATAKELQITSAQVDGALRLLEDGNSIPFIARYRKEATRGLDERQLRAIEDQWQRARDLAARKNTVLRSIADQGKLTPELRSQISASPDLKHLEELYLPWKPRRRTRAAIARERGLQPLAEILLAQRPPGTSRSALLAAFIDPAREVPDETTALRGACDIIAEVWSENIANRALVADRVKQGELISVVKKGKSEEGARFENYFDCRERLSAMPSHRFLAMQRGAAEGVLRLSLQSDDESCVRDLSRRLVTVPTFEFRKELEQTVSDCYERLLRPAAESAVLQELRERADREAVEVFARNLRDLLMAAPAGPQVTIGIDPGYRTGCKLAVVDATGRFLTTETIYPTPPREDLQQAEAVLLRLIRNHSATLIAIGNGTASRETEKFVADVIRQHGLAVTKVMVNESGASIYSASEAAIEEFPDLDVTVRGAISIAHRLQDPLAELVKIDARSIGVGQYQHDVDQALLKKTLDREVESCVNAVGVDLNTASASLLSYVAGIGPVLAKKITAWRDEHGAFVSRRDLLKVPRLGQKAFQQAAGFLRIRGGSEPLDNSAVHPEQYTLVQRMARVLKTDAARLIGNEQVVGQLRAVDFVGDEAGEFTVRDVLTELARPGRDPRSEFRTARFLDHVSELEHLTPGMVLEGVVTNVTKFGAFVDVGVHQDGLIHISQLADHFVRDPSEVVAVGQIVKVTVLEVDTARRRISLSRKAPAGTKRPTP